MDKVDNLVDEICELIESLDEKKKLAKLNQVIESDDEIKKLIEDFENAKAKYYEVSKYSTHHPDFKEVSHNLIKAKENLYSNEVIKEFKEIENSLSMLIFEMNKKLKSVVPKSKKSCH